MSAKAKITKIIDEEFDALLESIKGDISEKEKLELDLIMESTKLQILNSDISQKDEDFAEENMELYRELFRAMFNDNEAGVMQAILNLMKAASEFKLRGENV